MGNDTRCPVCNRFGTPELGGYCKACYRPEVEPYKKPTTRDHLDFQMKKNSTVVKRALLEVGKNLQDLSDEEVKRVYNCVLRRLPNKRSANIVQGASPMEKYGYGFAYDPEKYAIEKEVCGYENLE